MNLVYNITINSLITLSHKKIKHNISTQKYLTQKILKNIQHNILRSYKIKNVASTSKCDFAKSMSYQCNEM